MFDSDAEQARDQVNDWNHRAMQQLEAAQQMATKLERLSITATNDDDTVKLTIDASGTMTGLELRQGIKSRSADEIAAQILATQRKAQHQLGKGASLVVKDSVGLDSEAGKAVMAGYRSRFSRKAFEEMDARRQDGRS